MKFLTVLLPCYICTVKFFVNMSRELYERYFYKRQNINNFTSFLPSCDMDLFSLLVGYK